MIAQAEREREFRNEKGEKCTDKTYKWKCS